HGLPICDDRRAGRMGACPSAFGILPCGEVAEKDALMGKRKSTSQTTQSSTSVMTPTNPEWVSSTAQGLASAIQRLGGTDPYSLVAPASDLEQQAAGAAAKLGQG